MGFGWDCGWGTHDDEIRIEIALIRTSTYRGPFLFFFAVAAMGFASSALWIAIVTFRLWLKVFFVEFGIPAKPNFTGIIPPTTSTNSGMNITPVTIGMR
jgi:hypothetical protein